MKRCLCILLFALLLAPLFPAAARAAGYPDVPEQEWFYDYVTQLSQQGIVAGYPDGLFHPGDDVQYDQALKLVLLAVGYPEQEPNADGWAGGYLSLAIGQGFLAAQSYDLTAPIPRLTVAHLAARALELETTLTESPFADCSDPLVLALYEAEIITGQWINGQLCFAGDLPLRRSEVSAIIWRIHQFKQKFPAQPELPPEQTPGTPPETPAGPGLSGETPLLPEQPDVPAWNPAPPATITYGKHTIEIKGDVPVLSYDPETFALQDGRMTCSDPGLRLVHGVDVSSYQGDIDWNRVRADGIDFAMIRVGYRGYSVGGLNPDGYFDQNVEQAHKAGLEVGVYIFSQAISVEEALEEAEFVLEALRRHPNSVTGPVVFDWEVIGNAKARTDGLDTQILCDAANAFCRRIAEAGYRPMIYFNSDYAYLNYDLSQIKEYPFWLAQYKEQPTFYYDFQMWQYTSKGSVDGIKGNVDMDVWIAR